MTTLGIPIAKLLVTGRGKKEEMRFVDHIAAKCCRLLAVFFVFGLLPTEYAYSELKYAEAPPADFNVIVPDFLGRINTPINERPTGEAIRKWWEYWTHGYQIPALVAAHDAGILNEFVKGDVSIEEISRKLHIPRNDTVILVRLMESMGFLTPTAVSDGLHSANRAPYDQFLGEHTRYHLTATTPVHEIEAFSRQNREHPITQTTYSKALLGETSDSAPWAVPPPTNPNLRNIFDRGLVFPMLAAGDDLGIFDRLPMDFTQLLHFVKSRHPRVSEKGLRHFLEHLEKVGVVQENHGKFGLTKQMAPFLLKKSPFYKGWTIRLMAGSPASPELSISVLRGRQQTRMNESTVKEFEKALLFALHMDSQGAAELEMAVRAAYKDGDRVLDVGGGGGSASIIGALIHNADFLIFEHGEMAQVAQAWVNALQKHFKGRVRVVNMDMFNPDDWRKIKEEFKPNRIGLFNIAHDYGAEKNMEILKAAHETLPDAESALAPGPSKALVVYEMMNDNSPMSVPRAFSETLRNWTVGGQLFPWEMFLLAHFAKFNVNGAKLYDQVAGGPYSVYSFDKTTCPAIEERVEEAPHFAAPIHRLNF
jgi:hypothetical protein